MITFDLPTRRKDNKGWGKKMEDMKSRIYYITYINKDGFTATKPIIATSEKNAMKSFSRIDNGKFIKISLDII